MARKNEFAFSEIQNAKDRAALGNQKVKTWISSFGNVKKYHGTFK